MTVLGKDTFTRANQSGFGTASDGQTWVHTRGSSNWNIASNEGTVDTNSGFYNVFALGSSTPVDAELLVRYTPGATGDSGGMTIRHIDLNNFYYCDIGNLGQFAEIGKDVASSFSTISSVAFTWSAGTAYWMRFRVIGVNLSLKVWADGSAEPNVWTLQSTDSSLQSAGAYGIACDPIGATAMKYDSFYAVDYADCENLSVADGFLKTDSFIPVEANSASDSMSGQNGFNPTDSLSASDSLLAQDGYSTTDGLSALDAFLSQGGATWVEVSAAADSFSSGGTYLPNEGLSVSDGLLASAGYMSIDLLSVVDMQSSLQSWGIDALSVSDSFATVGTFLPVEALNAIESLLASDTALLADLLSIVDSFTGVSSAPSVPSGVNITFVTRDGKIGFTTRDGKATFLTRDGTATWKTRS